MRRPLITSLEVAGVPSAFVFFFFFLVLRSVVADLARFIFFFFVILATGAPVAGRPWPMVPIHAGGILEFF